VGRVLVVTAVEAERAAFERGLAEVPAAVRTAATLLVGGVGAASAAAATAAALAVEPYGVVVNAGIGGAFPESARLGDLLVAERIIAADLGADSPEGFLSVQELGFGTNVYPAVAPEGLKSTATYEVVHGDLLTVTTATGTAQRAAWLRAHHPAALGEAMEGYGVAVAAARTGLPVAEVRAVSNPVGPRDRAAWRIGEALAVLSAAAGPTVEGLISWTR